MYRQATIRNNQKTSGILHVKFTKLCLCFIDARCQKTNREVTFVLKKKAEGTMKAWIEDAINTQRHLNVKCYRRDDGMYDYGCVIANQRLLGRRGAVKKQIAYDNLIKEVDKDYNPVHTGSVKQQLVLGRGGLPTSANTSGKIGAALIKNIKRPEVSILKELTRTRKERLASIRHERALQKNAEDKYHQWCVDNGERESDMKSWEKLLRAYEQKGTAQRNFVKRTEARPAKLGKLQAEEAFWKRLREETGL